MELSRKAEKSYLIRRLSGVAPYDFPYRKKILKSMSLKQLRVVNKIAENITYQNTSNTECKRYSKTDVYVRTFGSLYQIYESDDMSKLYINSVFTELIDAMNVETERGEIQPQKWTTGQHGLIYITNNVMTLYCNYYHGQTELETELLSLIEDTSLLEKDMLVKKGEA